MKSNPCNTSNRKALVLISGGLDSILAARILQEQGIEVLGLNIVFPFDLCPDPKAERAASLLGIELLTHYPGEEYLNILKNPVYGYGKNINPCIDCRGYYIREAFRIAGESGCGFVATGEVLGQRPKSQRPDALRSVEKLCGSPEYLLRPLSARLLPETVPEKKGWVERARLYDIHGRSRRRQRDLVREFGIEDYPSSGGGCVLTEKGFALRLRDLFAHDPGCRAVDLKIARVGRQFRLSEDVKAAAGRNHSENLLLEEIFHRSIPDEMKKYYALMIPEDFPGPSLILAAKKADTGTALGFQKNADTVEGSSAPEEQATSVGRKEESGLYFSHAIVQEALGLIAAYTGKSPALPAAVLFSGKARSRIISAPAEDLPERSYFTGRLLL